MTMPQLDEAALELRREAFLILMLGSVDSGAKYFIKRPNPETSTTLPPFVVSIDIHKLKQLINSWNKYTRQVGCPWNWNASHTMPSSKSMLKSCHLFDAKSKIHRLIKSTLYWIGFQYFSDNHQIFTSSTVWHWKKSLASAYPHSKIPVFYSFFLLSFSLINKGSSTIDLLCRLISTQVPM